MPCILNEGGDRGRQCYLLPPLLQLPNPCALLPPPLFTAPSPCALLPGGLSCAPSPCALLPPHLCTAPGGSLPCSCPPCHPSLILNNLLNCSETPVGNRKFQIFLYIFLQRCCLLFPCVPHLTSRIPIRKEGCFRCSHSYAFIIYVLIFYNEVLVVNQVYQGYDHILSPR